MKIEFGKFYKTRNGHKVRIYATDGVGELPVHGSIYQTKSQETGWHDDCWTLDGAWNIEPENLDKEFDLDIISEWEDPKPRLKAWIHKSSAIVKFFPEAIGNEVCGDDEHYRAEWLDEPE